MVIINTVDDIYLNRKEFCHHLNEMMNFRNHKMNHNT
jgi:hypothetical protein